MILWCKVIDRWDWRRKVTGALEVTVELWDRLGWLWGVGVGECRSKQAQIAGDRIMPSIPIGTVWWIGSPHGCTCTKHKSAPAENPCLPVF